MQGSCRDGGLRGKNLRVLDSLYHQGFMDAIHSKIVVCCLAGAPDTTAHHSPGADAGLPEASTGSQTLVVARAPFHPMCMGCG